MNQTINTSLKRELSNDEKTIAAILPHLLTAFRLAELSLVDMQICPTEQDDCFVKLIYSKDHNKIADITADSPRAAIGDIYTKWRYG